MSVSEPTSYVVVEFDESAPVRPGFDRLRSLVDEGSVSVLDVEFIRSIQGIGSTVPASRVDAGLGEFDALDTRMLSQSDLDVIVDTITGRHMVAAALVYTGPIGEVLGEWASAGAAVVLQGTVADSGTGVLGG